MMNSAYAVGNASRYSYKANPLKLARDSDCLNQPICGQSVGLRAFLDAGPPNFFCKLGEVDVV
jgi:hypothetical protein